MVKGETASAGPLSVSAGPLFSVSVRGSDGPAALDTEAAANLARFKWLRRRNATLDRLGIPIAMPYPARAKFKFGNGHTLEGYSCWGRALSWRAFRFLSGR